jgi:hypothetical protein
MFKTNFDAWCWIYVLGSLHESDRDVVCSKRSSCWYFTVLSILIWWWAGILYVRHIQKK